jgi:transcriptional regulator with XRE-family HTH domain
MLTLSSIGTRIAAKRKALGLTQSRLASQASVGRSTLDALENARMEELGYSKVARILSALGLELELQDRGSAPYEIPLEDSGDQGLDRPR